MENGLEQLAQFASGDGIKLVGEALIIKQNLPREIEQAGDGFDLVDLLLIARIAGVLAHAPVVDGHKK